MIRHSKDKIFHVECSHCKYPAGKADGSPELALEVAEQVNGYAVIGKFHFCPSCFADMLERWKLNNKESLSVG